MFLNLSSQVNPWKQSLLFYKFTAKGLGQYDVTGERVGSLFLPSCHRKFSRFIPIAYFIGGTYIPLSCH